jgi:catechol 2,3-dioxygenase-like lactoylglutathione lyase family enzyme
VSPSSREDVQVRVARIGHIGIAVRDLEETVAFYTRMVGLRVTERFEYGEDEVGHGVEVTAGAFVRCDSTHHCISFFAMRNGFAPEAEGHPYGLHHIAFEMRTPAELMEKYREFKRAGIEIVNARKGGPGNQPRFYSRDPDGNLIEFYWGIDQVGWDGRPRAYPPIQEIELEEFDFAAYEDERERAADGLIAKREQAAKDLRGVST